MVDTRWNNTAFSNSAVGMLLEAARTRLTAKGETVDTVTLDWKPGGLCLHLDTSRDSHHVSYVPYPAAYNASMSAVLFARRANLPIEENSQPPPQPSQDPLTKALESQGSITTVMGAKTGPAAFRAPGEGTMANWYGEIPDDVRRRPVTRLPETVAPDNQRGSEAIEAARVRRPEHWDELDPAERHGDRPVDADRDYARGDPQPVSEAILTGDERQHVKGAVQGPLEVGRAGSQIATMAESVGLDVQDDQGGVTQRNRLRAEPGDYAEAFSQTDDLRRREIRPVSDDLVTEAYTERDDIDRLRDWSNRVNLHRQDARNRQRPRNTVDVGKPRKKE